MQPENTPKKKQKVFENQASKAVFMKGIKYLGVSLPLLFASPIVVTIGFKALRKDGAYFLAQAFRLILRSMFKK